MINPYSLLNEFSPEQAVQAITSIIQPKTPEEKNTFSLIMSSIRADLDSGKLPATITEIPGIRQERIGMRRISLDDTRDHRPIIEHHYTTTVIRITRADLLVWCEQCQIRPPLLFPDSPPAEKKLHNNERNTLLNIIRALAELHGNKPSSGAYRKEAQALLVDLASRGIEAPCSEKTLAGHLSDSFKAR